MYHWKHAQRRAFVGGDAERAVENLFRRAYTVPRPRSVAMIDSYLPLSAPMPNVDAQRRHVFGRGCRRGPAVPS